MITLAHMFFRIFRSFWFSLGPLFFYWDRKANVIEINWNDEKVWYL